VVSKRAVLYVLCILAFVAVAPLHAQEPGAVANTELVKWSIITAGFALGFAAAFGALGQSRGLAASAEAIARNPSAAGEIRGVLILGLVLIESLVIYVLLISLILFFIKPFGG
jgi:F-type H+-transporting ATPase subunit c